MATPTDILKLKIQVAGDENWGPATEENLKRLEEAIASEVQITSTGGAVSLTSTDYLANQTRRAIIRCTGTLASNLQITAPTPNSAKLYLFINATSGSFTTQIRFGSGAYLTVEQSSVVWIMGLPDNTSFVVSPTTFYGTNGDVRVRTLPTSRAAAMPRSFIEDRVTILLDRALDTPPGTPATGDTYHIGSSPSGAWSGNAGKIARWSGSSWIISDLPAEGLFAWVVDEGKIYVTDGGTLTDVVGGGGVGDGTITAAKLASDAVTTAKILDANVTEAKLASNAVALAKLKSDVYASESEAKTGSSTTKIPAVANIKHAAFPAGTRILFQQTAAPTGWTKDTSHNNKAIRLVSGTVGSGGSASFTSAFGSRSLSGTVGNTTLSASQIPAHEHFTVAAATPSSGALSASNQVAEGGATGNNSAYVLLGTATAATIGKSSSVGGGGSHTHSLSMNALDMAVQYVDFVIAEKDAA
jgi:hypothetical protein